ncbi:hypothetical protein [Streptomyces sp. KS 21]|uniref:hypothetical protein n=1 Tax=Streptomyces sp. KS 21 TaxID=2485150 RepID=UPI0010641D75|nr:hypothetical protein [Streptomyces sp. KS 21]TDU69208.1 hypothetical protein EDD91_7869 [Streptomyces sp. KS 21]
MSTTTTTSAQTETSETAETNAQQLTRLRRQRDALVAVLGAILALGALLAVRLAPSWANPVATGLSTASAAPNAAASVEATPPTAPIGPASERWTTHR